jgi:hypothetical protein
MVSDIDVMTFSSHQSRDGAHRGELGRNGLVALHKNKTQLEGAPIFALTKLAAKARQAELIVN